MSQLTTSSRILELATNFGSIRCWEHGSTHAGPPLVFLQGLIAGPDAWSDVIDTLAASYRCITVDWPFGAHSQPLDADADLSVPGLARLAVEVLDELGIERAVLIGNDSGGVVSQLVLAAAPERLDALVLVACDAFEVFPPSPYGVLFKLAGTPGLMRLIGAALTVPAIARSRFGFGPVIAHEPAAAARWAAGLRTDRRIRRDLVKVMKSASRADTLSAANRFSRFERPVLVVWAREDELFTLALGERLAAAFPNGRLVVLDDTRTFIPCDQPDQLASLITDFLAEAR